MNTLSHWSAAPLADTSIPAILSLTWPVSGATLSLQAALTSIAQESSNESRYYGVLERRNLLFANLGGLDLRGR